MSKTLAELSEEGRLCYAAGKHHEASRVLGEARETVKQAPGQRIDQGPDGSLLITYIEKDGKGSEKIVKQVPATGESREYRPEDYRDTSEDGKTPEKIEEEKEEHENTYGKVNLEAEQKITAEETRETQTLQSGDTVTLETVK